MAQKLADRSRLNLATGCVEWIGSKNRQGYGVMHHELGKPPRLAHRLSWLASCGTIPAGTCVCHQCDNPSCINPVHLFLGSRAENNNDRARKGRSGRTGSPRKLTASQVRQLRSLARSGTRLRELATQYGMSVSNVFNAANGFSYKEIQ